MDGIISGWLLLRRQMAAPRKSTLRRIQTGCYAGAALISLGAVRAGPTYTVSEIQMPVGATSMSARGVNAAGDVAGYFTASTGQMRGFIWSKDALTVLEPAPGQSHCLAWDISDSGVAVGYGGPFTSPDKAVIWTNGNAQALGTLGGAWSAATRISSNGLLCGWAQVEPASSRFHGFIYAGTTMTDAGLLPGGVASELHDINAAGVSVGIGQTIEGHFHAIVVDPVEGTLDLGTLGGLTSTAEAISDAGHITGMAQTGIPGATTFEGIVRHAFLWHQGKMLDLGTLPGLVESRGMDVNSAVVVVGTANNAALTSYRPFVWESGVMTDLNDLLPVNSGWVLRTANAVNESGWIVGEGTHNGQNKLYVLRPAPQRP